MNIRYTLVISILIDSKIIVDEEYIVCEYIKQKETAVAVVFTYF